MKANLKDLEKIAKALGDVNRLKILDFLAQQGGSGSCSAILGCLNLAQPSVSHHLKILTQAGLISAEKEGRNYSYSLQPANFKEFISGISFNNSIVERDTLKQSEALLTYSKSIIHNEAENEQTKN